MELGLPNSPIPRTTTTRNTATADDPTHNNTHHNTSEITNPNTYPTDATRDAATVNTGYPAAPGETNTIYPKAFLHQLKALPTVGPQYHHSSHLFLHRTSSHPCSVMSVTVCAIMSSKAESASDFHTRDVAEKLPVTGQSPTESIAVDKDGSVTPEEEVGDVAVVQMSNLRWFNVCVGLYLTAFLYGLDSTIAADVQGPILASLGNLKMLPWVGTGFLLGSVATISLFGSLYNKVEVKWLYLGSIIAFEIGSAICGVAPNMTAMAVGRVVAGMGGTGIYLG
ncbi:unnamed protein product [Parascedosporium putredinis]|uniref:Major facilitator superfamily (MFS) profile domain-containing protein n=1 Tax=Parascedosporium putredinis TaxID=1442378 RepID=A0A9P1H4Z7_9PEZI|nr:unnamed protein product [Parascedosporium putredinis]CAI7997081.1 unnamed protein product [Parascedosporium putredinis]